MDVQHGAGSLRRTGSWSASGCRYCKDLGLGYLTLGEETPSLSGGEAQRLKLAERNGQDPGRIPFSSLTSPPSVCIRWMCRRFCGSFRRCMDHGATVVVIEHDLDVIRSADYLIDMGPGGGEEGGRIVAVGTPEEVRQVQESVTARFL